MLLLWKNLLIMMGWVNEIEKFDTKEVLTKKQTDYIVNAHNSFRQKFSNGKVYLNGVQWPQAKNIYKLTYRKLMASAAQDQVNSCSFNSNLARFGQNICILDKDDHDDVIESCFDNWSMSAIRLNPQTDLTFDKNMSLSSNFTQLLWARTTLIGCGINDCRKNGKDVTIFLCNYFPAGNVLNEQVYEPGRRCVYDEDCNLHKSSKCEKEGLCSTTHDRVIGDRLPFKIQTEWDEL
ncbi:unnamed protein product [Bursaphelenchus okinawaensis]|uniref:SCP domain-containing protein n=1 Tax=Bursaphelenchus okinawaensis TaxID=465554 RepID=A0A811KYB7_9BILA|nr:unnamed protein product [Bursaphelenchus okinawaensis]CAG9113702.1 unnamed protein product [Bursaphelenchus okinawaensis]